MLFFTISMCWRNIYLDPLPYLVYAVYLFETELFELFVYFGD